MRSAACVMLTLQWLKLVMHVSTRPLGFPFCSRTSFDHVCTIIALAIIYFEVGLCIVIICDFYFNWYCIRLFFVARMPGKYVYGRCSCGFVHKAKKQRFLDAAICRCKSRHYDPDILSLSDESRPGVGNTLFVIMSHAKGKNSHAKLCKQLKCAGVPQKNIIVVYGFRPRLNWGGVKAMKGLPRLGFAYRWLPRVAKLLRRRKPAAVCYLENTATLDKELQDCMKYVAESAKAIVWTGYKKTGPWNTVLGSKCIAFKSDGLVQVHTALRCGHRWPGLVYLDMLLCRKLREHIDFSDSSFFGVREHFSVSEGKMKKRPAFH